MTRNYEQKLSGEILSRNYQEKLWAEIIRRNYEQKLSGEIMSRNYQEKLSGEIIRRNYEQELSGEIMTQNYQEKLWDSILCRAKCGNYRDTGVSKKLCTGLVQIKVYWPSPDIIMRLKWKCSYHIGFLIKLWHYMAL